MVGFRVAAATTMRWVGNGGRARWLIDLETGIGRWYNGIVKVQESDRTDHYLLAVAVIL